MMVDVLIIGAGVTGAFAARELSRYNLRVVVAERCTDVSMGTTKANSAIVHGGYDARPGTLKARLNVLGTKKMGQVCEELDVPFRRIGSFVLAFGPEDQKAIEDLYERGLANGAGQLSFLTGDEARSLEPMLSPEVTGVLWSQDSGIVCPFELALAALENAVDNGVELWLDAEVKGIRAEREAFAASTVRGEIRARYIVNAAGLYADKVARMIGDDSFSITPRRGEYLLLDKNQGSLVNKVIFQVPAKNGKGVLVTPTVDGNLLIGPTAEDIEDKEDLSTSAKGLQSVLEKASKSVPSIRRSQVIASFAGLRARPSSDDFIIKPSEIHPRFIHAAGIESPGLSSAPAIGGMILEILRSQGLTLNEKESFSPIRKGIPRFSEMTPEEINREVLKDSRYGRIVCRCEKVSEGEVVASIKRTIGATTLDGVKRRTRAGMGRCQGGFCSPRIVEILSRELSIPMEEVTKMGGESRILVSKTKLIRRGSL